MAYSKVILNGTTLMDVTQKTVAADKMLTGYTALKNDGTDITGSYTPPTFSTQSKTVSPSTSQQTVTADGGYDGLSSVTVNAISPTKSAQTYTPGTSNQTISSGRWLTGTQTILGDANLVAGNIKSGTTIFGVTGTYSGGGGGLQIYSSDILDNALELPTGVSMSDFFNGTVKAAYFTNIVIEYDGDTYTLSYVPICWYQLDPLSFDGYGCAVSDGVGFVVYYSIYDGSGSVDGAWSADYGAEMPVDSIEADQSLGSLFYVIK